MGSLHEYIIIAVTLIVLVVMYPVVRSLAKRHMDDEGRLSDEATFSTRQLEEMLEKGLITEAEFKKLTRTVSMRQVRRFTETSNDS